MIWALGGLVALLVLVRAVVGYRRFRRERAAWRAGVIEIAAMAGEIRGDPQRDEEPKRLLREHAAEILGVQTELLAVGLVTVGVRQSVRLEVHTPIRPRMIAALIRDVRGKLPPWVGFSVQTTGEVPPWRR